MSSISNRVKNLAESATIAMAAKSRELKMQGKDIISLSLGEPDFNTPDFVKDAAKHAIDENFSRYMAVAGYEDLRDAISLKFERDNGLKYTRDQIVVSTGAKQSIINAMLSLIDEGDEVIIPAPYWVTYVEQARMCGGEPIVFETGIEQDFKFTAQQLEQYISAKTKLIIFSNPCNPTGSAYTKEELSEIADVIAKNPHVYVISDEIYEHINFAFKHESLAQFDKVYNQTITINGVSKAFAMTGWRIGYLGAPIEIAKACTKIQGQYTSGASSIAQRAAKKAVEADPKEIQFMVDAFHKRRDLMLDLLGQVPGFKLNVPEGAFYLFPDVTALFGKSNGTTTINSASDLALYILDEALVGVVTGEAFGDPNCIRISYAASENELREAAQRIKEAVEKLK